MSEKRQKLLLPVQKAANFRAAEHKQKLSRIKMLL